MKYTIVISKPKNVRSTYVTHGVRNPQGGYGGTSDSGWSFKQAIRYELNRLPLDATEYAVMINGKVTESGIINR